MIELPFNSVEFAEVWADWIEYKRLEHRFKFKSPQSMKASLRKLVKLSNNNEETAIAIVEESMANGWKGFFALKEPIQNENKNKDASEILRERWGI